MTKSTLDIGIELAIDAGLQSLLVAFPFLNIPVVKQLFLFFSKILIVYVYKGMKLFGYEWKTDIVVNEKNADFKKSKDELQLKIEQGATDEEIAIARKIFVDNARKLARAGGNVVQG